MHPFSGNWLIQRKYKKFLLSPCQFVVSSYAYPFFEIWFTLTLPENLWQARRDHSISLYPPIVPLTFVLNDWFALAHILLLRGFKQLCFASLTSFGSSSRTDYLLLQLQCHTSRNASLEQSHVWPKPDEFWFFHPWKEGKGGTWVAP